MYNMKNVYSTTTEARRGLGQTAARHSVVHPSGGMPSRLPGLAPSPCRGRQHPVLRPRATGRRLLQWRLGRAPHGRGGGGGRESREPGPCPVLSILLFTFQMIQVGIVSLGSMFCGDGRPALYTRVSAFVDWIRDHLQP